MYRSCDDYTILSFENIISIIKDRPENLNKVTIITPCIRPNNLLVIKESIDFDYLNEWIIVYDKKHVSELPNLFEKNKKIKEYIFEGDGIQGNSQRNFALEQITEHNTYLYFLDDDNIIHDNFYNLLDIIEPGKIYTFDQKRPINVFPYVEHLYGNKIEIGNIDSAMFLIDYNLCKGTRWITDKYDADGYFIKECYENNKNNWIYVNKILAYYNKINN